MLKPDRTNVALLAAQRRIVALESRVRELVGLEDRVLLLEEALDALVCGGCKDAGAESDDGERCVVCGAER